MHITQQRKKSNINNLNYSFFQKVTCQRDLHRLQQAYRYLSSNNASDGQHKKMRGVQLAQRLIDPRINSIQVVLAGLQLKMMQLSSGKAVETSSILESEDSCNRYPCDYQTGDNNAAWMHFVNCLLRFSEEESIIDTDVYNYSKPTRSSDSDDNGEDNDNDSPRSITTESATERESESEPQERRGNFLSRLFRRNRSPNNE